MLKKPSRDESLKPKPAKKNDRRSKLLERFKREAYIKATRKSHKGGNSENYSYIINPKTGRKVNVNSNLGRNILKNYLREIGL